MCQKVDSSVDCHATAGAVSRNDRDISPVAQYDKKRGYLKKWILGLKLVLE
ncbi:hypothetical protein [Helicobacter canis]|uniref:Uncharacterized protein n=1 Tax=Helicobacter canis TaxID=29419 RepID=A0A377J1K6_9HELI|nr:hypothetical protein [Helicobacter canis]STO96351.1 Uncharacterised protein [Helicobacter canis]